MDWQGVVSKGAGGNGSFGNAVRQVDGFILWGRVVCAIWVTLRVRGDKAQAHMFSMVKSVGDTE